MTTNWLGLDGKTAVVTGAGRGIGRGTALELARAGARVLAIDLDAKTARETAELITRETGVPAMSQGCDTTDEHQVRRGRERDA